MSSRSDNCCSSSASGHFCASSATSLMAFPVNRGIALSRAARAVSRGCSDGTARHPRFRHLFTVVKWTGRPAWVSALATLRALGRRWAAQTSRASSQEATRNEECCFIAVLLLQGATPPQLFNLKAFLFPFGAPEDSPPCIRQRPFGIAPDSHRLPLLVRAPHRRLRCIVVLVYPPSRHGGIASPQHPHSQ
jgi:hypothetical protein